MKFYILTIFPEIFNSFLNTSIIKRAISDKKIQVEVINIRDFSIDKHQKTDDYPYGGGPGMVMTPQPIADSIKYVKNICNAKVIYFSPQGNKLNQNIVETYAKEESYILLCGHYEGIDYRIIEKYVDIELSIGDYILTGGELPAMVFVDSLSRMIEGVLGNDESSENESFSHNLLEYPQYTRPPIFEDMEVPSILLSGHHENIRKWKLSKSKEITKQKRPDLFEEDNRMFKD